MLTFEILQEESWVIEDMSMNDTGQKLALLARDKITGTAKVFTFGITLRPTAVFESDVLGENLNPTCVCYQRNKKQVCARMYIGLFYQCFFRSYQSPASVYILNLIYYLQFKCVTGTYDYVHRLLL